MWPWEHAAVGYVVLSLAVHLVDRRAPRDDETIIVLAATQFPDLIDKPLSWGVGTFPTGYGIGHSVLVAVPVGIVLLVVVKFTDQRPWIVGSFLLGYWSHLATDVVPLTRAHDSANLGRILWPLVRMPPYETDYGLRRGFVYFGDLFTQITAMNPSTAFIVYLLVPMIAVMLWLIDDMPGATTVCGLISRIRRT